jgi:Nucleotidyl transferase AbiEii toxin, Type IV TA system
MKPSEPSKIRSTRNARAVSLSAPHEFVREHHRRIARVLAALDGEVLRQHACYFAGGTCMALRFGEYRESVDMDFLVSDALGYRALRELLTGPQGLSAITQTGAIALVQAKEWRADQYGLRTALRVDDAIVKFEIVREGRMVLETPKPTDQICGVSNITLLDMATSKLLANSDRQASSSVYSRDLIDLAMMQASPTLLRQALQKAQGAYGSSVQRDLLVAIERMQNQPLWLGQCLKAMHMDAPKAVVWQHIIRLRRSLRILLEA